MIDLLQWAFEEILFMLHLAGYNHLRRGAVCDMIKANGVMKMYIRRFDLICVFIGVRNTDKSVADVRDRETDDTLA